MSKHKNTEAETERPYDPDMENRQADAAAAESATLKALQKVQERGCVVPDKLLCLDTVGSVPPGTVGYIDPYYFGVDADKRAYL